MTLPSEFLRGRISHACYKEIGVDALIAKDVDDYCARALKVGLDREYRQSLRTELKAKSEPLYSNDRVVREFESFAEQAVAGQVVDHVATPKQAKGKKQKRSERR